jgi:hypothetical protein
MTAHRTQRGSRCLSNSHSRSPICSSRAFAKPASPPPHFPHTSPCPGHVHERDLIPAPVLVKRLADLRKQFAASLLHLDHKYKVSWECAPLPRSRVSEDEHGRNGGGSCPAQPSVRVFDVHEQGREKGVGMRFTYPLCAQIGARDKGGVNPS